MSQKIESIKDSLAKLSRGDGLMEMLMEFERTLDGVDIFAYAHWIDGELVDGPHVGRYWFTTSWMYPGKKMPDPSGALRLEKIGCNVHYEKDILEKPTKIIDKQDWADPKTKKAKIVEHPIWVVTIDMPMSFVTERLEAFLDNIDDELDQAVEEVVDDYAEPEEDETEMDPLDDFDSEGGFGEEDTGEEL